MEKNLTTSPGTICIDEAASDRWDILVIGAGPAGAAAAHLLAQRGVTTLLVERQTWPRRKACGGCLNGRAISLLKTMRLDHVLTASHAVPLDGLVLQANQRHVELELSAGAAIDRMAFDAALVETAVKSGAAFLPGTTATVEPTAISADVRSVRLSSPGEAGRTVDARIVLVADGLGHPSLKQISSIDSHVQPAARVGLSLTIDELPASYGAGKIFMAISRAGYVGVVRTGRMRGNLAAAIDPAALRDAGGPANVVQSILRESGLPAIRFPDNEAVARNAAVDAPEQPLVGVADFLAGRCGWIFRTIHRRRNWLGAGFRGQHRARGDSQSPALGFAIGA